MTGIDFSVLGIRGTPKAPAPKTAKGRKNRFEERSQEAKDKAWEQRALKRMREAHMAGVEAACRVHANFGRWLRTLDNEEKASKLDRNECLDWDACELVHVLKLPELPIEVRWLAFIEFRRFLYKVKKRVFGNELNWPVPPFEKWKETDFELVKGALGLK